MYEIKQCLAIFSHNLMTYLEQHGIRVMYTDRHFYLTICFYLSLAHINGDPNFSFLQIIYVFDEGHRIFVTRLICFVPTTVGHTFLFLYSFFSHR